MNTTDLDSYENLRSKQHVVVTLTSRLVFKAFYSIAHSPAHFPNSTCPQCLPSEWKVSIHAEQEVRPVSQIQTGDWRACRTSQSKRATAETGAEPSISGSETGTLPTPPSFSTATKLMRLLSPCAQSTVFYSETNKLNAQAWPDSSPLNVNIDCSKKDRWW